MRMTLVSKYFYSLQLSITTTVKVNSRHHDRTVSPRTRKIAEKKMFKLTDGSKWGHLRPESCLKDKRMSGEPGGCRRVESYDIYHAAALN
jgi:hypothetical protein